MKRWYIWLSLIVVCILVCLVPFIHVRNALVARDDHSIISQQLTTIPKGQAVADVVIVGNDVRVSGDVYEILVVVNGNIHLTSSARAGIVVDLGGAIQEEPGAHVNALYHASLSTPFWNGIFVGGMLALLVWGGLLVISIVLVLLSVIVTIGLRNHIQMPLKILDRSIRKTGVIGFLVSIGTMAIIALLTVTLFGLPLAIVLVFLYAIAGIVGLAFTSLWTGKLALRNSSKERPNWVVSLLGSSLMVAFCNIPFVGLILFCLFWLIGIGVITIWIWGLWPLRKNRGDK
ncbi:hypothetical protein [Alicyclobacillus fastidiosus]|uniref:DUF8173 domain-containing protein n=1 Tax=Alicyclobacillus fastidiosus TaxID=392011 RepID=A0ABV5AL70_9BACL|nr:hypothetical protein [Alicyclobacillus fastidiosus]WEH10065.1 hypothetical protein PYS47_01905 [Alicyclobacillus fastidiosus]